LGGGLGGTVVGVEHAVRNTVLLVAVRALERDRVAHAAPLDSTALGWFGWGCKERLAIRLDVLFDHIVECFARSWRLDELATQRTLGHALLQEAKLLRQSYEALAVLNSHRCRRHVDSGARTVRLHETEFVRFSTQTSDTGRTYHERSM
jgi:hypothetical protein